MADKFSKIIVFGNWFVTRHVFDEFTVRQWGIAIIDKFASEKNRKTIKSKYICPDTQGIGDRDTRGDCEIFSLINSTMQF